MNIDKFELNITHTLYEKLSDDVQNFLKDKALEHNFSQQDLKQLIDICVDLQMWDAASLKEIWQEEEFHKYEGKKKKQLLLGEVKKYHQALKENPTRDRKKLQKIKAPKIKLQSKNKETLGFGMCPVASPKTRCCNLLTLDAVESCGFDCSYCSIQSFYNEGKITFDSSLQEKLDNLILDQNEFYHIGTGQSSDSLMWGNRYNVLEILIEFARKNPNVMLEFKTKSNNVSYFLEQKNLPKNLLFTWSLNPQIIIDQEEHLTASLDERLMAAKKMQDKGALVGFHLHPMVYFKGYQEAYGEIFTQLTSLFDPKKIVLVSLGTLTFIKPVVKMIRQRNFQSQILQMPFVNASGKLSYPLNIKREMFSFAYDSLKVWHDEVYFYMCMEDHMLWKEVFGYEYPTNESFEMDMKLHYMKKIQSLI